MARHDTEQRARIVEAIHRGGSDRGIARELGGVSHTTVARVRRDIGVPPLRAGSPARLPAQAALPFQGDQTGRPNIPAVNYQLDQAPPPPSTLRFDRRYHGYTFKAAAPPLSLDGWDVERIRQAISLHDQGYFLESSQLSIVVTRFGPVYAALSQALAPALGLPRFIRGGDRGLSRVVRAEVEQQIAPRAGLLPSPYFPPTLWGSMQLDVATMGFAVLQHVHGDEDPVTGIRRIYTRRWPTWAVQGERYRRSYQALTLDGPVDIVNGDGKFTVIGDTEEPHLDGAIRAIGLPVLDGTLVQQARASYIDRYGNPKWVATMPPNVQTKSAEGDDFFDALQTIQGPDGVGVFPNGSDYRVEAMTSSQSTVFKDALDNIWQYCAAILLGSDGTMSPSTGVYSAPIFAGVRRDIVARRLLAIVRGVNQGHIAPWVDFNYAASIAVAAGWLEPVLDIPLPDPEADQRIKSYADRVLMLHQIVKAERDAGFLVTQERVAQLANRLDIEEPMLAPAASAGIVLDIAPTDLVRWFSPDEIRASRERPPLPDGRGQKTVGEIDEEMAAAKAEREAAAAAEPAEETHAAE